MAVDREFDVYGLAVGAPLNPCNREGDGRAGGQAVGQGGSGQGSVEGAKSTTVQQKRTILDRNIDFLYEIDHFFKKMSKNLVFLKVEVLKCVRGRSFEIAKRSSHERGLKFEPK